MNKKEFSEKSYSEKINFLKKTEEELKTLQKIRRFFPWKNEDVWTEEEQKTFVEIKFSLISKNRSDCNPLISDAITQETWIIDLDYIDDLIEHKESILMRFLW